MILYIAEKPSAAKAIAVVLGNPRKCGGKYECDNGNIVSFCVGHLFEQDSPDSYLSDNIPRAKSGKKVWRLADLPIVPITWKYTPKKETKAQLKVLGDLIKQADEVINASDFDREGQAIVDHVLSHFKCSVPVKRFCVSAQDTVSIQRGLNNLKDNAAFKGWWNAAIARQRADWLVGMNLSRAFTLEAQAKGDSSLLVVGRVQSPTLALVVTRDRIIENFKPIDYYLVDASVCHKNGSYTATWTPAKDSKILDYENRIVSKSAAMLAVSDLDGLDGKIVQYEKEAKSIPQPLGLSLSDITLLASNKYGYTADQTLKTVQALYETHKLCSYPRSDCRYLPEAQKRDSAEILSALAHTYPALCTLIDKTDTNLNSRIWNDNRITAHHGIIVTLHKGDIEKLSEVESRIYDIIARRYIAQFYPKHQYDQTTIEVLAEVFHGEKNSYKLVASGRFVTHNGWRDVYASSKSEKSDTFESEPEQSLPLVQVGDAISIGRPRLQEKKTTPPKHFTEGTLIKALEQIHKYVDNDEYRKLLKQDDGIGTPATRSAIITDLKRREYMSIYGKSLISSDLGRRLIDTLPESVTSPVLTAKYERDLLKIQNDGASLDKFVDNQVMYIKEQIANASELIASNPAPISSFSGNEHRKPETPCPDCGAMLIRRKNTFKKTGFWWGCSDRECANTYPDKRGKPDFKASKPDVNKTEYKCPKCDSILIKRKSAKNTVWFGCSAFPKCKERFFEKKGEPDFN